MKTIKPLLLLFLLETGAVLNAQKPIVVSEDSVAFKTATYPGLIVSIPEVSLEKTQKSWIKVLESGTKSKVVSEFGEMTIFGAILKKISPNPVNIYSKLLSRDSLILLQVSLELKKDIYLEKATGEAELTLAKDFLKNFAKDQYTDFVKDELEAEEKKLKDLNDELDKLENEKSRMQKSIQSSKTTITTANDDIVLKNSEVTKLTSEILEQNNQLTTMEEGAAKEGKAGYLKDLEKQKKKLLNDIESSENKINKANKEIEDCNRDIPQNETQQEEVRVKVAQQEAVVQKFATKLETVKAY
jgi:hypothetical protein